MPGAITQAQADLLYEPLGGGGGTVGTALQFTLDFGVDPAWSKVFSLSHSAFLSGHVVLVSQSAAAAVGLEADENELEILHFRGVCGTGVLTVYVDSLAGPVSGKFVVNVLVL